MEAAGGVQGPPPIGNLQTLSFLLVFFFYKKIFCIMSYLHESNTKKEVVDAKHWASIARVEISSVGMMDQSKYAD